MFTTARYGMLSSSLPLRSLRVFSGRRGIDLLNNLSNTLLLQRAQSNSARLLSTRVLSLGSTWCIDQRLPKATSFGFVRRSSNSNSDRTSSTSAPENTQSTANTTATMAPIPPIFQVPIEAYKSKTHTAPEGFIAVTQPRPKIYLLTFNSAPDNRLTGPFCAAFQLALDILLTTLPPGVVITTSAVTKFYSNGLDYAGAVGDPNFFTTQLYPTWLKLVTFPWPTVALVNGHAFAGGLMLAMAHDYRIMNPHRGYLCLNELDFNAPLSPPMSSLFRVKLAMNTFRTLILEGKRFGALAALEAGIIDSVGELDDTLKIVQELGLESKLRDVGVGSYGLIKEQMYREIIADLDVDAPAEKEVLAKRAQRRDALLEESKQRVDAWKRSGGKLSDIKPKL